MLDNNLFLKFPILELSITTLITNFPVDSLLLFLILSFYFKNSFPSKVIENFPTDRNNKFMSATGFLQVFATKAEEIKGLNF